MGLIQKITLKVIEMDHFPPPKIHFPGIMTSFSVNPGDVIATAGSCRGRSRDSTATAVVNAIRIATKSLGTHDLKGCVLYCTSQPGLMSFTACLWARIETICYGVSQQVLSR